MTIQSKFAREETETYVYPRDIVPTIPAKMECLIFLGGAVQPEHFGGDMELPCCSDIKEVAKSVISDCIYSHHPDIPFYAIAEIVGDNIQFLLEIDEYANNLVLRDVKKFFDNHIHLRRINYLRRASQGLAGRGNVVRWR